MAKRLKAIEINLKNMQEKMNEFQKQRDFAQKELKKVNSELENTKNKFIVSEKDKTRTEFALKSEIKLLLEKLSEKDDFIKGNKGMKSKKVKNAINKSMINKTERELRSISTNDLHKNSQIGQYKQNVKNINAPLNKAVNRSFMACGPCTQSRPNIITSPLTKNIEENINKTTIGKQPVLKTRKSEILSNCSPNPIARSLNYFVKNTPIMRTEEFGEEDACEPQKENLEDETCEVPEELMGNNFQENTDDIPAEICKETEDFEQNDFYEYEQEIEQPFEADNSTEKCTTHSPNEQAIPVPRTTMRNMPKFAENYDLC